MRYSEAYYEGRFQDLLSQDASSARSRNLLRVSATAIRRFPRSPQMHAMRGDAITLARSGNKGWFRQVKAAYQRALSLDSRNVDALCGMAFLHDLNNDFKNAEKLLRRARKLESRATIDELLGLVLAQQGRKTESLRFLNRSPHRQSSFVRKAIKEIRGGFWNPIDD